MYFIGSLLIFNSSVLPGTHKYASSEATPLDKNSSEFRSLNEAITLNDSSSNVSEVTIEHPGIRGYSYYGASGHQLRLVNNLSAVNPTYQQMMDFVKADKTDKIPYNNSSFRCADFAENLHNNAEKAGYKCAFVSIYFLSGGYGHACNVFNTTDRGLIYIDCTGSTDPSSSPRWDSIVAQPFGIGKPYRTIRIGLSYTLCSSMGKIKDYFVYW